MKDGLILWIRRPCRAISIELSYSRDPLFNLPYIGTVYPDNKPLAERGRRPAQEAATYRPSCMDPAERRTRLYLRRIYHSPLRKWATAGSSRGLYSLVLQTRAGFPDRLGRSKGAYERARGKSSVLRNPSLLQRRLFCGCLPYPETGVIL